jgi:uncharacterized phage-associated protein
VAQPVNLGDIVLFIAAQAPAPLGITQVMKLVYLADVEHTRLYGEPLTGVTWTWHHHGPFTRAVYDAVETLDEEGVVSDEIVVSGMDRRRNVAPVAGEAAAEAARARLNPRAIRALARVLERYGRLPLHALKQAAYETAPMRAARPGDRLDLSQEPRRSLESTHPPLAEFLERAPQPDRRTWGDPAEAAAEDEAILRDLAPLRRDANRELE